MVISFLLVCVLDFQASTGYRESPDSAMRLWIDGAGFSSSQNHQAHTRTHSAGHASGSQIVEIINNPKLVNSNKQQRYHMYVCTRQPSLHSPCT